MLTISMKSKKSEIIVDTWLAYPTQTGTTPALKPIGRKAKCTVKINQKRSNKMSDVINIPQHIAEILDLHTDLMTSRVTNNVIEIERYNDSVLELAIVTGYDLIKLRGLVKKNNGPAWSQWVKDNLAISHRQANNYMKLAKNEHLLDSTSSSIDKALLHISQRQGEPG